MLRCRCGKGVAGKGSSQILQNEKEIPRLTGRSCGEFPGIGRTLPSRHSLRIEFLKWFLPVCDPTLAPLARLSALSADRRPSSSRGRAARHDAWLLAASSGERLAAGLPGHTRLRAKNLPPALPPPNHPYGAL